MNRRDLLHQLGWDDKLIDFFMVSDDDICEQLHDVTYTMIENDVTTISLGTACACNTLQVTR